MLDRKKWAKHKHNISCGFLKTATEIKLMFNGTRHTIIRIDHVWWREAGKEPDLRGAGGWEGTRFVEFVCFCTTRIQQCNK
jgi:hypothetical protein